MRIVIKLDLTEQQFDELYRESSKNSSERAQRKCLVVYLRDKGISRREVADIVRVDEDTVTEYVRRYREGGLAQLLFDDYRRPKGSLDDYKEHFKEVFEANPPHTVNEAPQLLQPTYQNI
jgi:transposase